MVLADVLKVCRDEGCLTVVMYGLNAVLKLCMHKCRSEQEQGQSSWDRSQPKSESVTSMSHKSSRSGWLHAVPPNIVNEQSIYHVLCSCSASTACAKSIQLEFGHESRMALTQQSKSLRRCACLHNLLTPYNVTWPAKDFVMVGQLARVARRNRGMPVFIVFEGGPAASLLPNNCQQEPPPCLHLPLPLLHPRATSA